MVDVIIEEVKDDKVPKHIIVTSLQKFVGGASMDKLKRAILDISKAVYDQDVNKLVFSTAFLCQLMKKCGVLWLSSTRRFSKLMSSLICLVSMGTRL